MRIRFVSHASVRSKLKGFFSDGLETDSKAYHILAEAVRAVQPVAGLFLEIGTRRGGSTKVMVEALLANRDLNRTIICLDPYGNIPYATEQANVVRLDYTNAMRDDTLRNLYKYTHGRPVNVHLLILEDTEYFKRFPDGYPVYDHEKKVVDKYALVFFDGPHDIPSLMREIDFFHSRTPVGGTWVFDDIRNYPHDESIEPRLLELGWKLVRKTVPKASYVKTR